MNNWQALYEFKMAAWLLVAGSLPYLTTIEKNFHAQEKFASWDFVSARGYSGPVGEAPVPREKQTSIERIEI